MVQKLKFYLKEYRKENYFWCQKAFIFSVPKLFLLLSSFKTTFIMPLLQLKFILQSK